MIDRDSSMIDAHAGLTAVLGALFGAAEATKGEETAVRRAAAARIAELEGARVRAYRRHHFVQLFGSVAIGAGERESALAAQIGALAARLDWGEDMTAEQREVIAALQPLMTGVADAAGVPSCPPAAPTAGAVTSNEAAEAAELVAALETFERWFATRFKSDFFRAFDRYSPGASVTDF